MSRNSSKGFQTELRWFLQEEFPLMPGFRPSRPAPAHIFNKFVYSLLGKGTSFNSFQDAYYSSPTRLDALLSSRPRGEIREDLKVSMTAVFNSDRRSWEQFSSYLPLHAGVVSSDASDDGFGFGLISLLTIEQRKYLRTKLEQILNPEPGNGDPLTRFATHVSSALSEGLPSPEAEIESLQGPHTEDNALGLSLFTLLVRRFDDVLAKPDLPDRVRFLLRMSNFLSVFVCLGLLFEGSLRHLQGDRGEGGFSKFEKDGVGGVLGIPVYCGQPPGPQREMSVELSNRCLKNVIHRTHQGFRETFVSKLPATEVDLERMVTTRLGGSQAQKVLSALREVRTLENPNKAFQLLLSEQQIHQSVKILGTKVGLAAPRKGPGKSRFVLETTFIDSLAYFVGEDGMRFESFVDECYQKLGLIVGLPKSMSDEALQRLFDISGKSIDLIPVLQASEEQCRQRLINCGLAQEFSDHATILRMT